MFPRLTIQDFLNSGPSNPKVGGQSTLGHFSNRIHFPDFKDFRFRQFGLRTILSTTRPFLIHHVLNVVFIRAKEKMTRIAASWIVAFVTNEKTSVEISECQNKSNSMGGLKPLFVSKSDVPVISPVSPRFPNPTFVGLFDLNFRPKSFGKIAKRPVHALSNFFSPFWSSPSNFISHKSVDLICATLSALTKREGTFIFAQPRMESTA